MKFFFTSFALAVLAMLPLQAQVLDTGFPQTNGSVQVVRLHGNTLYIGGDFQTISGELRPYLGVYSQGQLLGAKPAPQTVGQLQVWPNPAVSYVSVSLPDGNLQALQIGSSTGALVQAPVERQAESLRVATGQLPGGLYFLQLLMADGRRYEARVVVEKS